MIPHRNTATALRSLPIFALSLAATLFLSGSASGENWPGFRGPTGQGISTETSVPLHWSAESNIVWKTAIPGEAWSSPIVWGNRVFVTTVTDNSTRFHILSLDAQSGKVVWDRVTGEQVPRRKESKNSYATSTPATDGQRVYAVFGDGSFVALTMDGAPVWTNRDFEYYSRHGLGASPLLFQDRLIMAFDWSNPVTAPAQYPNNTPEERLGWQIPWDKSFLVALDIKTGKRLWMTKRGMSRIGHVSPAILNVGGMPQVISQAGDVIQGYDPKSGEQIWTVYSQGEGATPNFATGDGLIYTSSGFEKTTLRTVRAGGKGDITATHIAWEQRKGCPTQAGLVYISPYLYAVTDGGIGSCYKGETGEIVWQERVGGNFCASPVYADHRIYFLSEQGETVVIDAGPAFKILARNPLNEKCQASIAVSQGRLFLRTEKNLYCIGTAK